MMAFIWESVYLMSLLWTIVPKASPISCMTVLVSSSAVAPGMFLSPIASSAKRTSYPSCAPCLAVVETQTCAWTESALHGSTYSVEENAYHIPSQDDLVAALASEVLVQVGLCKCAWVVLLNYLLAMLWL